MVQTFRSASEQQTQELGARLASQLFTRQPAFVDLAGTLGAGKTALARGFIRRWSELAGDPVPETIVSPTYNIVKVYGEKSPLAHFDLYRLKSVEELEQIGVEQYFYDTKCCLVEWLDLVPHAQSLRPSYAVQVRLELGSAPSERLITVEDRPAASSAT